MKIFACNFAKANFKNRKDFFSSLASVADSYKATIVSIITLENNLDIFVR